jgi:hypothetical protein
MSGLRSTKRQAAHEETLRKLNNKSEKAVLKDFNDDQEKVRNSLLDKLLSRVPNPPSLLHAPSSEESDQKKAVQQGLALVLDTKVKATERFSHPASPTSKDHRDACAHLIASYVPPTTRLWRQFTKRVVNACTSGYATKEWALVAEINEYLGTPPKEEGNGREYTLFLWFLSLIGLTGTYHCRRPGLGNASCRRATVLRACLQTTSDRQ